MVIHNILSLRDLGDVLSDRVIAAKSLVIVPWIVLCCRLIRLVLFAHSEPPCNYWYGNWRLGEKPEIPAEYCCICTGSPFQLYWKRWNAQPGFAFAGSGWLSGLADFAWSQLWMNRIPTGSPGRLLSGHCKYRLSALLLTYWGGKSDLHGYSRYWYCWR